MTVFDCSLVTGVSLAECQALVALYNQTGGPTWTNQSNWLLASSACIWQGVTCSGNHVIALALPNSNLEGELPTQLQNLTFLGDGQLNLLGNAVFTTDAALNTFLIAKTGYSWIDTPVPPPLNESTGFTTPTDLLTAPDPFVGTPFTTLQANSGSDPTQDAVVTVVDAGITNGDMLTLDSSNATWTGAADDGVFLGLSTWGDFAVELTVNSLDAVSGNSVGLMVRVPADDDATAGGPGRDYVTLGVNDTAQIVWSSTNGGVTTGGTEATKAPAGLRLPDGRACERDPLAHPAQWQRPA